MTDLRAKLDELQKLCDGATSFGYLVNVLADIKPNDLKLLNAAVEYMPLLIEVARAAEKLRTRSNTRYALGRVPEYFDVLKALAAIKEADAK